MGKKAMEEKQMTYIEVYEKNYTTLDFIINDNRAIKLAYKHKLYIDNIVNSFEFYFSAVKPLVINGWSIVDYSTPRFHQVIGYDLHPVMFASLAEPVNTIDQYLDFAELKDGDVALDLGAYSGLSAIFFREMVGKSGRVIAVEPDPVNLNTVITNLAYYQRLIKKEIEVLAGAVWEHNDGIDFSMESSMGSTAVQYVGRRADCAIVPTYTLSKIAEMYDLKKIDFIKCDIEGGETVVFKDLEFFKKFKPRIIIEAHNIREVSVVHEVVAQMSALGYRVRLAKQENFDELPLVECYP